MKNCFLSGAFRKYIGAVTAAMLLGGVITLTGCGNESAPAAEPTAEPLPTVSEYDGKLIISEFMVKNRASLMDENGTFPDWIELENVSDNDIDLAGFTLGDGEDKDGWAFPAYNLAAGERIVVYADSTDTAGEFFHTDFSLSLDETLCLRDANGVMIDTAPCTTDKADRALMRTADGEWEVTKRCTPAYPNTDVGYAAWQNTLTTPVGLIITEVVVSNAGTLEQRELGLCDWVELKNNSDSPIDLGNYRLSDDIDALDAYTFPEMTLNAGESVVVICSSKDGNADKGYLRAGFDLSSDNERLYLSDSAGAITDYVYLHDIPAGGSYGRMAGQNGWFYFSVPQPMQEKADGARRVSRTPESVSADGVFNDVSGVTVELTAADGAEIYYTLDSSRPTTASEKYTTPIELDKTTVVRAIAVENGALPSAVITLTYIINEGHTLPVVSLTADDIASFTTMYNNGKKDIELSGNIALYADDGGFSIPCGIDMHGETSLSLPKKNMGIYFRSRYGENELNYDIFGGGETTFGALVMRAGQDQTNTIIRNELLENLCLQYSSNVPTQRSKYCVLYLNGEYNGIYAMMEKVNEAHYAKLYDVTQESVTVMKASANPGSDYYEEVIRFAKDNDLTTAENYAQFCELVDIDSLIDWMIIEGYSANTDLSTGNLRYVRSTEGDGKWRFMLYDLDATLTTPTYIFANVLKPNSTQSAVFICQLINNPDFRARFLTRAAQVLSTTLTNENVDAEIVRLSEMVAPEIARDCKFSKSSYAQWEAAVDVLRCTICDRDWNSRCIAALRQYMSLTADEMAQYFPGVVY